jgi:diguanylate cyclase (GGDEF)-like protein/PAS domain S-box-containing protein
LQTVLNQTHVFNREYRIIRVNDKKERWVHGKGKVELNSKGEPVLMLGTIQDITERKIAEIELRRSEERLNLSQEYGGVGSWDSDLINNTQVWSLMVYKLVELPFFENPTWDDFISLIHPDDRQMVIDANQRHLTHREKYNIEYRVEMPDKQIRWMRSTGQAEFSKDGTPIRFSGVVQDITDRKLIENNLTIAATAFESQEGMFVTDEKGCILRTNQAFTEITGYNAEEVIGKNPRILNSGRQDNEFYLGMWGQVRQHSSWSGEIWNKRKNGEIYPQYLTITEIKNADGRVTNYVATLTDITQTKKNTDEIERLAFYDQLTELPNRRLLHDRLKIALASSKRTGLKGALLFIDLDNFKILNDTLGHDIGDLLLREVAYRLTFCVRQSDTVARLGGDEFVVMLEDLDKNELEAGEEAKIVGNEILQTLNNSYQLSTHTYKCTSSIGITIFNGSEKSMDETLKQADIAMYQAKTAGRNTLQFFNQEMQISINNRAALEKNLHIALAEKQFQLYYQAQVHYENGVVGAEALVRWIHPEDGLIPPIHFISLAEETGLIVPLGQWILEEACQQIKRWESNLNTQHLQLAVNVSAKQFHQTHFLQNVRELLQNSQINPNRLKLELTESLLLDNVEETINKMDELKKLGICFSMDDFGTGYSSLSYLTKLPLNQLKIDQAFIRNIGIKSSDAVIIQTIIGMTKNLGMNVIAEGVETKMQQKFLQENHCDVYQGYLFSKPVPLLEFEKLIEKRVIGGV